MRETEQLPQAPNVLLSIRPEHAESILDGEKTWEYRKVAPKRGPPMRLVLYASAPVQAAVGEAWTWTVREDSPDALIDETVSHTPHEPEDVRGYFGDTSTGYALRIGSYLRFNDPVSRETLEASALEPSQNFRYIGTVTADPERVESGTIEPGGETRSDQ